MSYGGASGLLDHAEKSSTSTSNTQVGPSWVFIFCPKANVDAGESHLSKIKRVREEFAKKKAKATVLNMLDEVAWLFNLRGSDIDFNPGTY
jgi:hypothetical protein